MTIATRSPRGSGWRASSAATSSCSSSVSTRMTPAWSKRASTVASEASSSAPVCDDAARFPAAVRPLLTATRAWSRSAAARSGRSAAGCRATRGRAAPRRCRVVLPEAQEVVAREVGLVAHRDERGQAEPAARRQAERRDAVGAALRGEGDAPGGRPPGAKVALSATAGSVLSTPRQLGPTSRIPAARQMPSSSSWRARPSAPSRRSRRTARRARARPSPRTPARPRARAGAATRDDGQLDGFGHVEHRRERRRPAIVRAWGLIGYSAPAKPPLRRLLTTAAPMLPRRRDAPIDGDRRRCQHVTDRGHGRESSRSSKRARASGRAGRGTRRAARPARRAPRAGSPSRGRPAASGGWRGGRRR